MLSKHNHRAASQCFFVRTLGIAYKYVWILKQKWDFSQLLLLSAAAAVGVRCIRCIGKQRKSEGGGPKGDEKVHSLDGMLR